MAIRIERSGSRTVVAQTRRAVRIALWSILALDVVGVLLMLGEPRGPEATAVRCSRAAGRCEVDGAQRDWVIHLDSIARVTLDDDDGAPDGRVAAVIARHDGLPAYRLCEASAADPEAAGIREVVARLTAFLADRQAAGIDVACQTRRPGSGTGALVARAAAQFGGVLLILLALALFLVEIRTEIDRDAGVVRVAGRSLVPPRRWSVERGIAEVTAVMVRQRSFGRERSFRVHLHFADGTTAMVLSPVTGWSTSVDRWMDEMRQALGLEPPARP